MHRLQIIMLLALRNAFFFLSFFIVCIYMEWPFAKESNIALMELWITSNSCASFWFTHYTIALLVHIIDVKPYKMIVTNFAVRHFAYDHGKQAGSFDITEKKCEIAGHIWRSFCSSNKLQLEWKTKIHFRCDYSNKWVHAVERYLYDKEAVHIETNDVNSSICQKNNGQSVVPQFMDQCAFPGRNDEMFCSSKWMHDAHTHWII